MCQKAESREGPPQPPATHTHTHHEPRGLFRWHGDPTPSPSRDDVSVKVTTDISQLQPIEYNRNP